MKRFVRRVKRAVNRAPRDADVSFHTASLPAIPSQTGLRLDARRLRASVESALDSIGGGRSVRGHVKVVQPKVTTADLADKYPRVVTVDRANFKLRLFKNLKLAKTYKIAVGQVGLETPAGVYHVQNKATDPAWHVPNSDWAGDLAGKVIPGGVPENPLKSRWLGIYDGAGIHGTDAISLARHGGVARLHPHGGARRRGAVRRGAGAGARLHPVGPSGQAAGSGPHLVDRDLLPALALQRGLAVAVANTQSADPRVALAGLGPACAGPSRPRSMRRRGPARGATEAREAHAGAFHRPRRAAPASRRGRSPH